MAVTTREAALRVLEVDVNSAPTDEEIKKAYKKLALQVHPDKNPDDPDAKVKFQELGEAYRFLTEEREEEIYEEYYSDDLDLFNLLNLFYELRRASFGGGGFYSDGFGFVDDRTYHVHPCCHGCGHHAYFEPPPVFLIKGKKVREPSKKWVRKQMKRQYNAEREDYDFDEPPVTKPRNYNSNNNYRKKPEDSYQFEEYRQEASEKKEKKPKPKKTKQPEPPAPKKLTKEELEKEQQRRREEKDLIAKQIDEQQKKEAEKELKRQEKERQRQEDLKKASSLSMFDLPTRKPVTAACEKPKKPTKKKKQKNDLEKKSGGCGDNHTADFTGFDREGSRDEPVDTEMPNKKNRSAAQPQKGPGVVNISENASRTMPPVYRQDSRFNDHSGGHYQQSKPKSNYERTKEDYRSAPKGPSPFAGVSHLQSPQRPERARETQSAWGKPQPSAWGSGGNAWGSARSAPSLPAEDDDWDESGGFEVTPVSRPVQVAPPPKENVWQQRMEFYHGAMPGSEAEEERMLQAALELSRLQDEEEQLRLKMEEEDRLAELAKTSAKNQSLYAYNEANSFHMPAPRPTRKVSPPSWSAPPPSWPAVAPEKESKTPEDVVTSEAFTVNPKPSPWGTSLTPEESHQPRPRGFMRGVGRGSSQSSRSVSVSSKSSDTNSESMAHVKSPKRPEPRVATDVWDSGSDCDDNCDEADSNGPPTTGPQAGMGPAVTKKSDPVPNQPWAQETTVSAKPQHTTPVVSQQAPVARESNSAFSSNQSQSDAYKPDTATSVSVTAQPHTASNPAQPVPSRMNGLPSESARAFGRGRGVARRQYGPRARAQRTVLENPQPATASEPPAQQPSMPSSFYTGEDTTEKLRNLCDRKVGLPDSRSDIPKKNNIFSNLEPAVEKNEGTNASCDNDQRSVQNGLAQSLPVFPSAVPLDLRKSSAPTTSSNSATQNGVQDLRTQLGGLTLGGGIWSQPLVNPGNIPDSWGQTKPEAPRLSRSSSDASDSAPTSSPDLLEANTQKANTANNSAGNFSNDIGSYLGYSHPYMNMQMPTMVMPQMYGMGYQGVPMAHGLGLTGLAIPGAAMPNAAVPRQAESHSPGTQQNMQMAGMMPYGLLPGMMPHMSMPMGAQGVANMQADPQATNGHRQQTPTPPLAGQPMASQANFGSWNGMMSQYGMSNGYAQNHAQNQNNVPSSGDQGSGQATQPRQTSPPMMTQGMPMMPGLMPFLPTMPLIPQHYGNQGNQGNQGVGNQNQGQQAYQVASGNQQVSTSSSFSQID